VSATSRHDADPAEDLEALDRAILDGVERALPAWVRSRVAQIADAWGRLDAEERTDLAASGARAASVATARVVGELRALFAVDLARQRTTPLEIVRTAVREPTAALQAAGIPPVVRDAFDERAWPDDRYGLVIRHLGDLGDPDLAPLHLAWGLAKAKVLRERSCRTPDERGSGDDR
jgi:hypothetical protein